MENNFNFKTKRNKIKRIKPRSSFKTPLKFFWCWARSFLKAITMATTKEMAKSTANTICPLLNIFLFLHKATLNNANLFCVLMFIK